MDNRGIVYIAVGQDALSMAIDAARSVMDHSANHQSITILCDREARHQGGRDYSDANLPISFVNIGNYSGAYWKNGSCVAAYLKTKLCRLSPYDKTLYLDNDIRAVKDIDSIWDYVSDGIGLSRAFRPLVKGAEYVHNSEEAYTASIISNWNQYNAGMFLFVKSESMFNFFDEWSKEWERFRNHENMALTRLLDRSDIQSIELPCKFNDFYPNRNNQSVLIHYISHFKQYLQ